MRNHLTQVAGYSLVGVFRYQPRNPPCRWRAGPPSYIPAKGSHALERRGLYLTPGLNQAEHQMLDVCLYGIFGDPERKTREALGLLLSHLLQHRRELVCASDQIGRPLVLPPLTVLVNRAKPVLVGHEASPLTLYRRGDRTRDYPPRLLRPILWELPLKLLQTPARTFFDAAPPEARQQPKLSQAAVLRAGQQPFIRRPKPNNGLY